ncbi:MAG: DUF554 domain-containing protein [Oscillospiraceae bacterium]|nr:DUF554 domain-containing protein [Oscillospiraceae bacterium]
MILTGALVNGGAILITGVVGTFLKRGIPERFKTTLTYALSLCVILIGISGALKGEKIMVVILSMVIGGVIGELLDIDKRLHTLGDFLQRKLSPKGAEGSLFSSVSKGFVSCSLIVCVGSMAIVGSIQSGMSGNHETLLAKSLLDGVIALIMASTMGIGVSFSGIAVFVYEGLLTVFASFLATLLPEPVITEMTCVGSLLIIAVGTNMTDLTDIKVANLLPATFMPIFAGLLGLV